MKIRKTFVRIIICLTGYLFVLSCAAGVISAAGNSPEGLPYNDSTRYTYFVKTSYKTDKVQNYFGLIYNITVRDKKSSKILSNDSYEIGFKNLPAEENERILLHEGYKEVDGKNELSESAESRVYIWKNLNYLTRSYSMGGSHNKIDSWQKFKSEKIQEFQNPQGAVNGSRRYREGKFWGRDALFLESDYSYDDDVRDEIHTGAAFRKTRSFSSTIYVCFNDIILPSGFENTIVMEINTYAQGWAAGWGKNEKAEARADELFAMAKSDMDKRLAALNAIPVTVKKTVNLRGNEGKAAAPAPVKQTENSDAAKTPRETAVSVISVIVTGAAAAAVGAGAAAAAGTAAGGEGANEGEGSSYKMCIYKDFGDKIKYNAEAVYIYARMVEVNAQGVEVERPDLTGSIEIFSDDGALDIGANTLSGAYMGASVRAISADPKAMKTEGVVSVRFTGAGGEFRNNVRFKLVGPGRIKLESDVISILATSSDSFELKYELVDFDVKPDVEVASGSDMFELKTGKNDLGEDVITATPTALAGEKLFERFVHRYACEITAKNERETVTEKFDVQLCYEGIGTAYKDTDNNTTKEAFILTSFTDGEKEKREENAFRLPLAVMRWNNSARKLEPDTTLAGSLEIEITADTRSRKLAVADAVKAVEEAEIKIETESGPSQAAVDYAMKPEIYMIYPEKSVVAAAESIDLLVTVSCDAEDIKDLCLKAGLKPQNDFRSMIRWFIEYPQGTMADRYITLANVDTYLGALDFIENRVFSVSSAPFTPKTKENHYEDGKLDAIRPRCVVLRDDSMPHSIGEFSRIQSLFHELTHVIEDQNGDIGIISSGGPAERHTYFIQYLSDVTKDLTDMEKNPYIDVESAVQSVITGFHRVYFNPENAEPQTFAWFGTVPKTQHFIFDKYADFHVHCSSSALKDEQKHRISRQFRKSYFPGTARGKFKETDGFFKDAVWTFIWGDGWLKDLKIEHPGFRFSEESPRQWEGGNRLAMKAVYYVESLTTGKNDVLNVELDAGTFNPDDFHYPKIDKFTVKRSASYKISDCIMGKPQEASEAVRI